MFLVAPGAAGNFADIFQLGNDIQTVIQTLAAAVVNGAEVGEHPVHIGNLELLGHFGGAGGEQLCQTEGPGMVRGAELRIAVTGQVIGEGLRAVGQVAGHIIGAQLVQLIDLSQQTLGQTLHDGMQKFGAVHHFNVAVFNAHPLADTVPDTTVNLGAFHMERNQTFAQNGGFLADPFQLVHVHGDDRHLDLFNVLGLFQHIVEAEAEQGIVILLGQLIEVGFQAPAGILNGLGEGNIGVEHHVDRHILPAVQLPAQFFLEGPVIGIFTLADQNVIVAHLIPADLMDGDHGTGGTVGVVVSPELTLFVLDGQCGNFGVLADQGTENFFIVLIKHMLPPVHSLHCFCSYNVS